MSFPALTEVHGSLEIRSSEAMSCDSFDKLALDGGLTSSQYHCETASDSRDLSSNPKDIAASDGRSSSPASGIKHTSESLSEGTKIGIGLSLGVGGALVLAASALLVWRRRRKHKASRTALLADKDGFEVDRAPMLSNSGQKHELELLRSEMPLGNEAQELPAVHGKSELGMSVSRTNQEGIDMSHEMPVNEEPHSKV